MYEHQPLFADVDSFLRGQGFVFHRFVSLHGRPMKPLHLSANPLQPISQQLWADAVYVRDLWELQSHSRDQLLKLVPCQAFTEKKPPSCHGLLHFRR